MESGYTFGKTGIRSTDGASSATHIAAVRSHVSKSLSDADLFASRFLSLAIVETRSRIGDWEADTVIGKNHRQAIVSIVERKTGFTLIQKVERKTAFAVSQAMIGLLKPHRKKVHTITSDNGKEFAGHEEIASKLKATSTLLTPIRHGSVARTRTRMD